GAGVYAWFVFRETEQDLAKKAWKDYADNAYRKAAEDFQTVKDTFPSSEHIDEYDFMRELSELRAQGSDSQVSTDQFLDALDTFIKKHKVAPSSRPRAREAAPPIRRSASSNRPASRVWRLVRLPRVWPGERWT